MKYTVLGTVESHPGRKVTSVLFRLGWYELLEFLQLRSRSGSSIWRTGCQSILSVGLGGRCCRVFWRRLTSLPWFATLSSSLDSTIEPWLQGLWPVLKETLAKLSPPAESSVNDLSTSVQQLNLAAETKPSIERQISSSNRFKADQDSVTYSAALAELTSLTLPPKPMHSLAISLVEASEVTTFVFASRSSIFIGVFLGNDD